MLTSAATSRPATQWSRTVAAVTAALVLTTACTTTGGRAQNATSQQTTATTTAGYDAATRDDAEFNRQFKHQTADIDGVKMHYVTGGTGEPLVLLHGWPQSWYSWREVMPALAEKYTVYALDLPGLGDSEGAPSSYDKATLARYVHGLLAGKLGLSKVKVVGHDLGAGVAFQYAAIPGRGRQVRPPRLSDARPRPQRERLPSGELAHVIPQPGRVPRDAGRRRRPGLSVSFLRVCCLRWDQLWRAGREGSLHRTTIDEYARTYQRPQVLTGGFELYRTLDQDERDNKAAKPITVPTMLLTAEGTLDFTRSTVQPLMSNITRAVEVPKSGHWLIKENPEFVTAELVKFFASEADR